MCFTFSLFCCITNSISHYDRVSTANASLNCYFDTIYAINFVHFDLRFSLLGLVSNVMDLLLNDNWRAYYLFTRFLYSCLGLYTAYPHKVKVCSEWVLKTRCLTIYCY